MWAAIGPPRLHKTYSLCALFLSSFCRNTAVFFFCSSSNSRFNSLTIAISLAGSLSATAARQRSRQSFPGILGHDASQKRKGYTESYNTNVRRGRQPILCKTSCNLPTIPPRDNLHSKNESGASGRKRTL